MDYLWWEEGVDDDLYQQAIRLSMRNPGRWAAFGAAFGIPAGLVCPVIGTILTVTASVINLQAVSLVLNELSIASLVFTIPLLALGAHCLDVLEGKPLHAPPRNSMNRNTGLTVIKISERAQVRR